LNGWHLVPGDGCQQFVNTKGRQQASVQPEFCSEQGVRDLVIRYFSGGVSPGRRWQCIDLHHALATRLSAAAFAHSSATGSGVIGTRANDDDRPELTGPPDQVVHRVVTILGQRTIQGKRHSDGYARLHYQGKSR
jgi:hypothetical protein